MKSFNSSDIEHQLIFENDFWSVIIPENPVFSGHLIIVSKSIKSVDLLDLSVDELVGFKDTVSRIVTNTQLNIDSSLQGYNVFFNAGDEETGKHYSQFHAHIFLRFTDETESPYDLMNNGKTWYPKDSLQWTDRRDYLRRAFDLK